MSEIKAISDLHLGHKNIMKFTEGFRPEFDTIEEHDEWILDSLNQNLNKRDILIIAGDVAFTREGLLSLRKVPGQKFLVRGNHDKFEISDYLEVFKNVCGLLKWKGFWWSHAPIHPEELRGKMNIHGHTHQKKIQDSRYINICVEALNCKPITFEELKEIEKDLNSEGAERYR